MDKILAELQSMKRGQQEDKFLSKIDMMFAVLVTLTIFTCGLIINNSLNQPDVNRPLLFFGSSTLVVFIIALFGEFTAILRDKLTQRFDFWAFLINGLVQVAVRVVVTFFMAMLYYGGAEIGYSTQENIISLVLELIGGVFTLLLVPLSLVRLHHGFTAKFSARQKEIKKRGFIFFSELSIVIMFLIRIPDFFLIPTLAS